MVDPIGIVTGPGLAAGRWGFLRLTPHWRAARTVRRQLQDQRLAADLRLLRQTLRKSGLLEALQSGNDSALQRAAGRLKEVPLRTANGVTHDGELLARLGRLAYTRTSDPAVGLTMLAADAERARQAEADRGLTSFESALEAYSLPLRASAAELRSILGESAVRVVRELSGSERLTSLRDWTTSPPPWLPADARLYAWLAELTQATSSNDGAVAAAWFGRAIDFGGSPRAYLKLRRFYAHDDHSDSRFLDELADVLGEPLVQAVGPTDAPPNRLEVLDRWRPTTAAQWAFRSLLRTQLLEAQGEYDQAIAEGQAAFQDHGHLAAGLNAAVALLRRSYTDPRRTHGTDIASALALASTVRAQQIEWGLDSGRALAITVRAHMALANTGAAWALISPDSDATDIERRNREVREAQVSLLVEFGRLAEARTIVDDSFPHRLRLQIEAREAELAFDTDTSIRLWSEVVDETDDLTEKASFCLRLAMQGQLHPWVAELRELNAEVANEVELIAELYSGSESAENRARALIQDNMRVAHALIARYMDTHRTADVAHFAERAAEKWNIADDWLRAAIGRIQLGEQAKAATLASRALTAGGTSWGDRERAYLILIEAAYRSRNWVEAVLAAEGLLVEVPDHEDARWAVVGAHAHTGELDSAYTALAAHPGPLSPRTTAEAALWLDLFRVHGTDLAPVADAVEVIRQFSDDSAIRTKAVPSLLLAPLGELPASFSTETILSELQEKYPDDPGFEVLAGLDTDDADELLDLMDQALGPLPDFSDLEKGLARGTTPIGAASLLGGKTYTEVLIRSKQRARFAGSLDGVDEISIARRALTQPTVVDTTALLTLALLGTEHSALILPAVPALRTAVEQLMDARQAQQTMSRSGEMTFIPTSGSRSRTVIFTDAATLQRDAELVDDILGLFRQTERADVPSALSGKLPQLQALSGAWTSALSLAADTAAALWCDDAATRRLALELGVEAFGTPALLQAIAEATPMGEAQGAIAAKLVHLYTVGVPFDPAVYELALDFDGWQPLGTAIALRHSGASSLSSKLTLIHAALDRAAGDAKPDSLRDWSQVLGEFISDLDVGERRKGNQVRVTQTLLAQHWQTPSTLPFVAAGLRQAFGEDWTTALSSAVRELRQELATSYGHAVASGYLLALIKGLPEEDRLFAVGSILER